MQGTAPERGLAFEASVAGVSTRVPYHVLAVTRVGGSGAHTFVLWRFDSALRHHFPTRRSLEARRQSGGLDHAGSIPVVSTTSCQGIRRVISASISRMASSAVSAFPSMSETMPFIWPAISIGTRRTCEKDSASGT
jgi:hypothetical protein